MKHARSNAFTLMDTMISVALVAVALGLASELVRLTLRAGRGLADAQTITVRFDAAMGALRKDVWNAAALRSDHGSGCTVERNSAVSIRWSINTDGTLSRESAGEAARTWDLGHQLVFDVDGTLLRVSSPSDRSEHGEAMSFLSQRALAGGAHE